MRHERVRQRCLREWKRIGVPEGVANEMTADLDADLKDAAADDVSPEEVLGNGVFDPPSFARQWAAARGVVSAPVVPSTPRGSRRTLAVVLAVLAALLGLFFAIGAPVAIAVAGVLLVVRLAGGAWFAWRSGRPAF